MPARSSLGAVSLLFDGDSPETGPKWEFLSFSHCPLGPFRCLPHQRDCVHLEERSPVLRGGAAGVVQFAPVRPHRSDGVEREAEIQHR